MTYTFSLTFGYQQQHVNIWIDFNNDDILTPDEMILYNFFANASGSYDVNVTIPPDALTGSHHMRAMAVYGGAAYTNPCGTYQYGEAEDYTVEIIDLPYGNMQGYVTEYSGGAPVQGALVRLNNGPLTDTTDALGFYEFTNLEAGEWNVTCTKNGYNPINGSVTIIDTETTDFDFSLTAPTMVINSPAINVAVEPFSTHTEAITISNNGNGWLVWDTQIDFLTNKKSTDIIAADQQEMKKEVIATGQRVPIDQMMNTNIPIQASYEYFSGPDSDVEIIGGTSGYFTSGPEICGNLFSCTVNRVLIEFLCYHSVITYPTQLWMLVYESDTKIGNYNLEVAVDVTPAPMGEGWVSSGEINYSLQEGKYYMIASSFEQVCISFWDYDVSPFPYPVSFGEAILKTGGLYWSPTPNFPPDQTIYVPNYAFLEVQPKLFYQKLITTNPPEDWLSVDPVTDTLNPGSQEVIITLNAGDIPLGTSKTAVINFTSFPDVGTSQIFVSMLVGNVGFEDKTDQQFKIYPNPASQKLHVESGLTIDYLQLLNTTGQIVAEKDVYALHTSLDISNLESGLYYLQVTTVDGRKLFKVTIQ